MSCVRSGLASATTSPSRFARRSWSYACAGWHVAERRGMRVCLMTMVLLTPVPSNAGPDIAQVQLGMAYERLSNGYEPWRSITLDVRAGGSRGVIHAAVDESTRFSQVDHNITAGFE